MTVARGSAAPVTGTSAVGTVPALRIWSPVDGDVIVTAAAGAPTVKVTVAVPRTTPSIVWVAVAVYVPTGRSANATS